MRNAEHMHIRSPTELNMSTSNNGSSGVTTSSSRLNNPIMAQTMVTSSGGGALPFVMGPTCPPYPHQHYSDYAHFSYHKSSSASNTIPGKISGSSGRNNHQHHIHHHHHHNNHYHNHDYGNVGDSYSRRRNNENNKSSSMRRSIPPPVSLPMPVQSSQLQIQKQEGSSASLTGSAPKPMIMSHGGHNGLILGSNSLILNYASLDNNKKNIAQSQFMTGKKSLGEYFLCVLLFG